MTSHGTRGPPIGVIKEIQQVEPKQAVLYVYRTAEEVFDDTMDQSDLATKTTLCTLDIPSYMSIADFLNFVAPVDASVSHYRILRDATPHRYMVLMTFRDTKVGQDYYKQYNNRKFSSMEDEVCQIVYLTSIKINSNQLTSFVYPFGDTETDGIGNCPVCLEPLDEAFTGLLTISCQHTFHVHCLSQWGDGSCPVCRYSQKSINDINLLLQPLQQQLLLQEQEQKQHASSNSFQDDFANECQQCGYTENLWICLVCGQIGCGRGHQGHALAHYEATSHLYALEIETQRVWDYAGDGYVHRLIQNAVDGKLVELPQHTNTLRGDTDEMSDDVQGKLNAMAIEYSYLLTSQLDSQRMYYEDKIDEVMQQISLLTGQCKEAVTELDSIQAGNQQLAQETEQRVEQLKVAKKERSKLDQKLANWKDKTRIMERHYLEEKELTASISCNNDLVKDEIEAVQLDLDSMTLKSTELMACLESQHSNHG